MRKHFSTYIEQIAEQNDDVVFITGDLGYNALENLESKNGTPFYKCRSSGAEYDRDGCGYGFTGAPCYLLQYSTICRVPLPGADQERCLFSQPPGLRGRKRRGYGYGIMGSSHHAIEDIACLSGLPNMRCFVPAFIEDMKVCLDEMFAQRKPAYFRLGLGKNMPDYLALQSYGAHECKQNQCQPDHSSPMPGCQ